MFLPRLCGKKFPLEQRALHYFTDPDFSVGDGFTVLSKTYYRMRGTLSGQVYPMELKRFRMISEKRAMEALFSFVDSYVLLHIYALGIKRLKVSTNVIPLRVE